MDGTTVKSAAILFDGLDPSWQIAGAGDLDGDGRADLIWRNNSSSELVEWLMNGDIKNWSLINSGNEPLLDSTLSDQVEVSSYSTLSYPTPDGSSQTIVPLVRLRNKNPQVGLLVNHIDFDMEVPGLNVQKRIEPGASRDLFGLVYGDWEISIKTSSPPDTLGVKLTFIDDNGRSGTITVRGKIGDASPGSIDPGWITK